MGKICKMLRKNDVGSVGIGAMIVFIAMVLVAGIAASVLIQTSTKLESQAMRSGQETIGEVATGLAVFDIEGKKGTSDLRDLAITVRCRAGASDVDLNETTILITDGTTKALLTYYGWSDSNLFNSSVNASGQLFADMNATAPDGNWTNATTGATLAWGNLTAEHFGIIVLQDADGSCTQTNPVINKGDKVVLALRCDSSKLFGGEIAERTDVYGQVIPEIGSPGVISFTTPASYSDIVYDLQ